MADIPKTSPTPEAAPAGPRTLPGSKKTYEMPATPSPALKAAAAKAVAAMPPQPDYLEGLDNPYPTIGQPMEFDIPPETAPQEVKNTAFLKNTKSIYQVLRDTLGGVDPPTQVQFNDAAATLGVGLEAIERDPDGFRKLATLKSDYFLDPDHWNEFSNYYMGLVSEGATKVTLAPKEFGLLGRTMKSAGAYLGAMAAGTRVVLDTMSAGASTAHRLMLESNVPDGTPADDSRAKLAADARKEEQAAYDKFDKHVIRAKEAVVNIQTAGTFDSTELEPVEVVPTGGTAIVKRGAAQASASARGDARVRVEWAKLTGAPRESYAADEALLLRSPKLSPRVAGDSAFTRETQTFAEWVQNGVESLRYTATHAPEGKTGAALAVEVGGAAVALGASALLKDPVKAATARGLFWRGLQAAGVTIQTSAAAQQMMGATLEEFSGDPDLEKNPKLKFGMAAVVTAVNTAWEGTMNLVTIGAILGIAPGKVATMEKGALESALREASTRILFSEVKRNPRGVIAKLAMDFAGSVTTAAKAGGGEESAQALTTDLGKYILAAWNGNSEYGKKLEDVFSGAGEQGFAGAAGEGSMAAPAIVARQAVSVAMAQRLTNAQKFHLAVAAHRQLAAATPEALQLAGPDLVKDLNRMTANFSGMGYADLSAVQSAIEKVSAKRGIPASEVAKKAGVDLSMLEEAEQEGAPILSRLPVSHEAVLTKWGPAGLLEEGVGDHLAFEPDGVTLAQTEEVLREVQKLREEEAAAREAEAKNPRRIDTEIRLRQIANMSSEEKQRALYTDPVTGVYSGYALEDMAESLAAKGYHIVQRVWESRKIANEALTEGKDSTHQGGDALFRAVSAALIPQTPLVFKRGGDIFTAIAADSPQEAEAIARQQDVSIRGSLPDGFMLSSKAGAFVKDESGKVNLRKTLEDVDSAHKEELDARISAGTWAASREHLPTLIQSKWMGLSTRMDQFKKSIALAIKKNAAPLSNVPLPPELVSAWPTTPEGVAAQMQRLYVTKDSALLTARAKAMLDKASPHKFHLALDMRLLGEISKLYGRDAGDMVLAAFGAMTGLFGGPDFRVAHLHGDEFAASSNDEAALRKFAEAWEEFANNTVMELEGTAGTKIRLDGIHMMWDIGASLEEADAKAVKRKQELDAEADRIEAENNAALKEDPNAQLKPFPRNSRQYVRASLAEARGEGQVLEDDVPGRDAGKLGGADALRGRDFGQNLDGLVEALRERQVGKSAAAIAWQAREIENEIRAALRGTPSNDTADAFITRLRVLAQNLTDEASWRIRATGVRTPDDVGAEEAAAWIADLKRREEIVSGAAVKIEKRAAARIKDALDKARKLVEKTSVGEEFKENRAKADPLFRLSRFLFKSQVFDADGKREGLPGILITESSLADDVAAGVVPQAVFDRLKKGGRLTTGPGTTMSGAFTMAGLDRALSEQDWLDAMDPPTDIQAAKRASVERTFQLAEMLEVEENVLADTIGAEIPVDATLKELKAISSRLQQGPGGSPALSIRKRALRLVAGMRNGEISHNTLLGAERRAAERATREAVRGNLAAALVAKQEQLLYQYAARLGSDAKVQHKKLKQALRDLNSKDYLRDLHDGSQAAVDFVGHVLNKFGRGKGRFPVEGMMALGEVLAEVERNIAFTQLPFSPEGIQAVLMDPEVTSLTELTTEQAENLLNGINAVRYYADFQGKVARQVQEWENGIYTAVAAGEADARNFEHKLGFSNPDSVSPVEMAKMRLYGMVKSSRSMPALLAQLSPRVHDDVIGKIASAIEREDALYKDVVGGYLELMRKHEGVLGSTLDPIDLNHLRAFLPEKKDDPRRRSVFTRGWAIGVALNAGNVGNLYWLLTQEGWTYQQVQGFLNATLTKEEWAMVEDVWKFMDDKVYPIVNARFKEKYGFSTPKVDAQPMFVPALGRTVSGGYYPVRFDHNAWAAYRVQNADELSELHGQHYQGAVGADRGYVVGRRQFATIQALMDFDPAARNSDIHLPLDLRMGVMLFHLEEVVHHVTFERPVLELWKLTQSKEFEALANKYGGYRHNDNIRDWLQYLARGRADGWPAAVEDNGALLNALVNSFTAAVVGADIGISAADLVNPLIPALVKDFTLGNADPDMTYRARSLAATFVRSPTRFAEMYREAQAKSQAIRVLSSDLDKERIQSGIKAAFKGRSQESIAEWVQRVQWYNYEYATRVVATVVWHTKVTDSMRLNGGNEEAAIADADRLLYGIIPSHRGAFQSSFQRNHAKLAFLGRFMTFFFKVMGEYLDRAVHPLAVEMVKSDGGWSKNAGRYTANSAMIVGAVMATSFVANVLGELIAGNGPGDKEEPEWWVVRKMALGPIIRVPVVGRVLEPVVNLATGKQSQTRAAPYAAIADWIVRELKTASNGRKADDERMWAVISAVLAARGLPSRQIKKTGSFFVDWLSGNAEFGDPLNWMQQAAYGTTHRQRGTNPYTVVERNF